MTVTSPSLSLCVNRVKDLNVSLNKLNRRLDVISAKVQEDLLYGKNGEELGEDEGKEEQHGRRCIVLK